MAINLAFRINADIENARRINRAIEMFEGRAAEMKETTPSGVAQLAGQWERVRTRRSTRKLTIHRYFPTRDLGGILGLLRFDKSAHQELIQRGYDDAKKHDCAVNRCVLHAGSGERVANRG